MSRFIKPLIRLIKSNPKKSSIVIGAAIHGSGDLTGQFLKNKFSTSTEKFSPNWNSVLSSAFYGGVVSQPLGSIYPRVDRLVDSLFSNEGGKFLGSVALKSCVYDPLESALYLYYSGIIQGKSKQEIKDTFAEDLINLLKFKVPTSLVGNSIVHRMSHSERSEFARNFFSFLDTGLVTFISESRQDAAQVVQEKYEEAVAALAEMEKRAVVAESMLEATLQDQSGQLEAQPSPRQVNQDLSAKNVNDQSPESPESWISLLARPFGLGGWHDKNKNTTPEKTLEKKPATEVKETNTETKDDKLQETS